MISLPEALRFGSDGLLPVIVQDVTDGTVLMLAYMNAEALEMTRRTGYTHFWSRSRQAL
jgi:phosphoribosyl-ATP pyrophosphohydrolase/phosphoribosyl-AMP cyclohydrolase